MKNKYNKYTNIFDSHAHYDMERFKSDKNKLIAEFKEKGIVAITNIGADMQSSRNSIKLANEHDYFYATVGVHPHSAKEMVDKDFIELEKLTKNKKCVAIGEIGLDYHYDYSPRDVQKQRFRDQMKLAQKLKMPVVIHSREATEDVITILKEFSDVKCVIHSFSGSVETARIMLKMGHYLGFTGVVTFQNARVPKEVAAMVPLDRFLIETDAPFLAPTPFRGKRCDSSMVYRVAEQIAEIRGMNPQEIINRATKNTKTFYQIP